MVSGLVIHTKETDKGKLQRSQTASAAATSICPGMGMKAMNKPTKNPIDAE